MALRSALVDRARIIRKAAAPVKIEGRTSFTTVTEQWFRCRLDLRASSEGGEPSSGQPRTVKTPQVLIDVIDADGNILDIRATDRLEIDSPELGQGFWDVEGDPEPLRKKRRVIGWQATIKQVAEHEYDPTLANV